LRSRARHLTLWASLRAEKSGRRRFVQPTMKRSTASRGAFAILVALPLLPVGGVVLHGEPAMAFFVGSCPASERALTPALSQREREITVTAALSDIMQLLSCRARRKGASFGGPC